MQMVNETKEQSSRIGSGLKSMASNGLKGLFRWLGSKSQKSKERFSIIETLGDGFFVVEDTGYGSTVCGPYKREQDAKGVRTRLMKQHD